MKQFLLVVLCCSMASLTCMPARSLTEESHLIRVSAPQNAHAIQIQGPGKRPSLFFACCDQGIGDMESWVSDPKVVSQIRDLGAGLAVAISDFSPERAQAVHQLNDAGIPLVAWFVLSPEQGYYLNSANAAAAVERFAQFEKWTAANHLRWNAVGLDIEPNFQQLLSFKGHRLRLLWLLAQRYFESGQVKRARNEYSELIRQIQAAGYPAQTYQMAFMADERAVHSTVLERLFGLVDVRGDEEVLMAYGSMNHAAGSAVIYAYGPSAQTIAIGSTLGEGQPGQGYGPLSWNEFSDDLIVAGHFSKTVGVYSLEGCIRQGFLPRMNSLDWGRTVTIPVASLTRMHRFQMGIRRVLWIISRLSYIVAILFIVVICFILWLRKRRRKVKQGI